MNKVIHEEVAYLRLFSLLIATNIDKKHLGGEHHENNFVICAEEKHVV
jgi:hypothetical protein